jgi:hypothetical protein
MVQSISSEEDGNCIIRAIFHVTGKSFLKDELIDKMRYRNEALSR